MSEFNQEGDLPEGGEAREESPEKPKRKITLCRHCEKTRAYAPFYLCERCDKGCIRRLYKESKYSNPEREKRIEKYTQRAKAQKPLFEEEEE